MSTIETPKPNNLAISWFYGEHKKESLILNPRYQRNPIWSDAQNCFLIDSIISGCPVPQVYINVLHAKGASGFTTKYEVVDGQQRLSAILKYVSNEWALLDISKKSYPVSSHYKKFIGKKFDELPNEIQERIWNCSLAVQELRGWAQDRIESLFRRLNYVVMRLNRQEMRHSQYYGEFLQTSEKLADLAFWDRVNFFTRRASQRMKDIEFVSELLALTIEGPQDGQKDLDRIYAKYDAKFPKKSEHQNEFGSILQQLDDASPTLIKSRFFNKEDFYSLFGAVLRRTQEKRTFKLSKHAKSLVAFANEVAKRDKAKGNASEYYSNIIQGSSKRPKREARERILYSLLG